MKNLRALLSLLLVVLIAAPLAAQTPQTSAVEPDRSLYVELAGPRVYRAVQGDSLWGLSPNQWRIIQAASGNERLMTRTRIENGVYYVHLDIDQAINIPEGMTIRMRLNPDNVVGNPERGGPPFVAGGVNPDNHEDVRRRTLEAAVRDHARRNPDVPLRTEDFEIIGNIERGQVFGPGIVFFSDRPNEGRPTIYNGEPAYRATVRNRRTGQQSQQLFLQACGNDGRQGQFLRADGEGFRFVLSPGPNSTIPGNPPVDQTTSLTWLYIVLALAAAAVVAYVFGFRERPAFYHRISERVRNFPSFLRDRQKTIVDDLPPAPIPPASEPIVEPAPAPVPLQLATSQVEPELTTLHFNGVTYRFSPNGEARIVNGRVQITGAAIVHTETPKPTRPRRVRSRATTKATSTGS